VRPGEQIDGLALPRAATLARRRRAGIGGLALGEDLQVEGPELRAAILGQRAAGTLRYLSGDLVASRNQHRDQAVGPRLPPLLEEGGQFPQVRGVAQGVVAGQITVGLPAVVYEGADKGREQASKACLPRFG
jgi:hypothetical protein